MARFTFGAGSGDLVTQAASSNSGVIKAAANLNAAGTFWSAQSGGSQYTDLIDPNNAGVAIAGVSTDANGRPKVFQGPDGVSEGWLDFGAGRFKVVATDITYDSQIAAQVNNASSSTRGALDGKYVGKGSIVVNVKDYATPQAAMAALTSGCTLVFPQGTYALTGGATLQPPAGVNDVTVSARGATFTTDTWGKPVFDLLDVHGWTLDIGLAQYVGVRGNHAGTLVRGQSPYALGSAVYTNGDRHYIRRLRSIGLPTPINLSSWNGTAVTGRYGQNNKVGRFECEGYDFGILWIGQKNLVIEDIYAHDDIDDSSGSNPTHAYYCTATSAWRSSGVQIKSARCENNLYGHAYQLKNCDAAQLGPHSADNCKGLINVVDCNDLSWTDMKGTNTLTPIAGNGAAVTLQTVVNQCQRPVLKNTTLTTAADQDSTSGIVSIQADDAQVGDLAVTVNHSAGVNTGTNDIVLRGSNGRLRSLTLKSVGAAHARGVLVSNAVTSTGWKIERPVVNGQRSVVDVQAGCSGTGIDYDPAAQTLTGAGAAITGSTSDYYVVGNVPTMGEVDSSSGLTLTGAAQDIPGATVTIVPAVAGKLHVVATYDFSVTVAGEILGGYLNVDGTNLTPAAFLAGSVNRAAVTRHWTVSLTAASHTIKLQAYRVSGTGTTHSTNAIHTGFSYQFVPGAN